MLGLFSFSFLIVCVYSNNNFKEQRKICPAPEPVYCGPYEVKTDCEITCPPQTCESIYMTYKCREKKHCRTGCNCIEGYLRNAIGMCVPRRFCPSPFHIIKGIRYFNLPRPRYHLYNREWAAPSSAITNVLKGYSSTNPEATSLTTPNTSILTQGGSPFSSPSPLTIPCKGANEVYHPCPLCVFENCDDVDCPPIPCNKEEETCNPRCICVENFFRNASDICVSADDCPYYDIE